METNGDQGRGGRSRRRPVVQIDSDSDVQEVVEVANPRTNKRQKKGTSSTKTIDVDEEGVRAPIPQTNDVLSEGDPFALMSNQLSNNEQFSDLRKQFKDQQRAKRSGKAGGAAVFDSLRDFQGDAQAIMQSGSSGDSVTARKNQTLSDIFRPPVELITHGSFDEARHVALQKGLWLLINIHNYTEFPCQRLVRDCLRHEAVKEIIEENFVFWSVNHDSREGLRYCTHYKVSSFPHMSIVDPRTGEKVETFGEMNALDFCNHFSEFLVDKPSFAPKTTALTVPEKKARIERQLSVDIIDRDLEDDLKLAIKLSEEEAKRNKDKVTDVEPNSMDDVIESFLSDSDSESEAPKKAAIPTPVDSDSWKQYLGAESDPKITLKIRIPTGSALDLTVPNSSQMRAIFAFVESKGFSLDKYDIVMPGVPLRSISSVTQESLLIDNKFSARELLLVQERS